MAVADLDLAAAAALVESGAVLLDVREPDEWEAGHAPGAVFIPMNSVTARLAELPSDRAIVVICRSGGRSGVVTEALAGLGFDAVNLSGGMQAWAADARPVVTDAGTPGAVI
ncbi:MAG: rhodanese-like domain-containing protein [Acidimicrobiales bacterium]|jgi:rhodanese-related sulfurtransferase